MLFVNRLTQGRGIQTYGANIPFVQEVQRLLHEFSADPVTAQTCVHEHHGHPGDLSKDTSGRGGDGGAVPFRDEAAVRFQVEKTQPVRLGLIPARLLLEPHAQGYISSCHSTDLDHSRPSWIQVRAGVVSLAHAHSNSV